MEVSISVLKQETTQILNNLTEEVIVTKRGKPIAKVVPILQEKEHEKPLLGQLRHLMIEMGDVVSPIGGEWEANRD